MKYKFGMFSAKPFGNLPFGKQPLMFCNPFSPLLSFLQNFNIYPHIIPTQFIFIKDLTLFHSNLQFRYA